MATESLHPHPRRTLVWVARAGLAALGLVATLALGAYVGATVFPDIGAQYVDVLRGIIGDAAVAQLETLVYQVQDSLSQWSYHLGVARPTAPWAAAHANTPVPASTLAAPTVQSPTGTATAPDVAVSTISSANPSPAPASTAEPPPTLTPTAVAPMVWAPAPLTALGGLAGEGQWTPYLQTAAGQPLAYRTFLQPDRSRPYALVAVVAFDLRATRLHFVLGSAEPVATVPIVRPGRIRAPDLLPGRVVAAFNGGFKARQGHFGAMADGVTALPARAGLATVAMYTDGQVRIGAWGTDITASLGLESWRQNGPLLIHDGQVNPRTADNSPADWGATLTGETAVWRSGLGISADGQTLYYLAGPSLNITALASAMAATGAAQAMELDINNYWVHFEATHWPPDQPGGQPTAEPLLDSMQRGTGRYLGACSRDFFYLTAQGG